MICSFLALLSCFHLSGFYVDGAFSYADIGEMRWADADSKPSNGAAWYTQDGVAFHVASVAPQNPYVRVAVGYDLPVSARWSVRLDLSHESSIATGRDGGTNQATLGATWRPFGRSR